MNAAWIMKSNELAAIIRQLIQGSGNQQNSALFQTN